MSAVPVVYVVDDDPSVARALTRVIRLAGLRCEAFASAHDFLNHQPLESPSCLVLDVQLPDQSGLDLQKELKDRGWPGSIVFITGHGTIPMAVEAMQAGAVHFLPKPFDNRDLLTGVQKALERERERLAERDEERQIQQRLGSLSPRERQVFRLVARGMANKNVAARLGVSLQTVKLYRGRLMQKLKLNSVADLVRLAERAEALPSHA